MKKKGDDADAVSEEFIDKTQVLSPKHVKGYADAMGKRGYVEFNNGSILVRSRHPLDECLRRGIIEEEHHEAGKRLCTYRDCAFSKTSGRAYNGIGEGDSEMDAATIYSNAVTAMKSTPAGKRQWDLISIVCFSEPDIDGHYFREKEYSRLFGLAPNIQYAFERTDEAIQAARKALTDRLAGKKNP